MQFELWNYESMKMLAVIKIHLDLFSENTHEYKFTMQTFDKERIMMAINYQRNNPQ